MLVAKRTRYALRAIFELAKSHNGGVVKIADIAEAQAIPCRFLEVILSQLKQGGFVNSKRGIEGGYFLLRSPAKLTVGEVVRFMQGPVRAVSCFVKNSRDSCPLFGHCVFLPMWEKVHEAIAGVYDTTTFQGLVDQERDKREKQAPSYSI